MAKKCQSGQKRIWWMVKIWRFWCQEIHCKFGKKWEDCYGIGGHVVHVHSSNYLYLLANKLWILECNFAIFFLYVYFLQCLFLLSYFFRLCCFFYSCKWILDVLVFFFSYYVFNFWCGWFIILWVFFQNGKV